MTKYYNLNENKEVVEVPFEEWLTISNNLNRRVAITYVKRKPFNKGNPKMLRKINKLRETTLQVSTVFLSMDHRFNPWDGEGEPIIFETMVFNGNDYSGMYQTRYCTYEESLIGHEKVVGIFSKPLSYFKYL